jgi:hypothetical protein
VSTPHITPQLITSHPQVFSDRDLSGSPQQKERVAQALSRADALFASLLFDYDQVGVLFLEPGGLMSML